MIDVSWLLWVLALGGLAVLLLVFALLARILGERHGDLRFCGGIAAVLGGILGIVAVFVSLPWSTQYHVYRPVTGTVGAVQPRFQGDGGGGTDQNFVVQVRNRAYLCTDSRCAAVRPGDRILMYCRRSFQFNTSDEGYVCNWGYDRPPNPGSRKKGKRP